ncbi:MAG TPA: hypothetical protein VFJ06_02385 [Halococcus sp.]|nr:hypothetical protein [Halococcus sp.]
MPSVEHNYCLDCEWSASLEDHGRETLSRLAIEHAVEYGHDIESDPSPTECEYRMRSTHQL